MKKKIKLKDLTEEQYGKWIGKNCKACADCPLDNVRCESYDRKCWIKHKDLFSDKFLNQEIEIEVPELLDKKEKEYLEAVLKPFKDRVIYVKKGKTWDDEFIIIAINSFDDKGFENIDFPAFKKGTMYKGLELNREYKLKDLGLFQKIKFSEFWGCENELAIHCKTLEEAKIFCKKSDELGKKWASGNSYLLNNSWERYREATYYSNWRQFGIKRNFDKIYEFEDVDFDN